MSFRLTNLDDEPHQFLFSDAVIGIDDLGRQFGAENVLGSDGSFCGQINPGESTECHAIFDVDADVALVSIEFHVQDERVLPLPDVEDSEDDEEEEE